MTNNGAENLSLQKKSEEVRAVTKEYLPGIVCWGDSLTVGAGGDGVTYPDTLASLIKENITDKYNMSVPEKYRVDDIPVVNMGVGGESSATITARSGGIPFKVQEFIIPEDATPTEIMLISDLHKRMLPLIRDERGVNPVSIAGVEGVITEERTSVWEWTKYFFTRSESGDAVAVEKGTPVVTYGSEHWLDYINVVFIGTNGDYRNADELIMQQRAIVSRGEKNTDRFIVIGIYDSTAKKVDRDYLVSLADAMKEEYGDNFIDLYDYLLNDALSDAGIEPTEKDRENIEAGRIPSSLTVDDGLHLNAEGYELVGHLIFERMDSLGYFDEVKGAIAE